MLNKFRISKQLKCIKSRCETMIKRTEIPSHKQKYEYVIDKVIFLQRNLDLESEKGREICENLIEALNTIEGRERDYRRYIETCLFLLNIIKVEC